MSREEAIVVLCQAGFLVEPWGKQWWVVPPPGSPGGRLQPSGTLLTELFLISVARTVKQRMPIDCCRTFANGISGADCRLPVVFDRLCNYGDTIREMARPLSKKQR
ncbi:MAG: hypothetical protein M3R24_27745 [Chloroflexota bacterium]|nr:hypothetical protein [Chloroflexota bacterium]